VNDGATRLATSYTAQAQQAIDQNDTARALQLIERALLAKPDYRAALDLQEQLAGGPPASVQQRPPRPSTNQLPSSARTGPSVATPHASGGISPGRAINSCLTNYASFSGRAPRAEYWWWFLFLVTLEIVAYVVHPGLYILTLLALLLPTLAVSIRRLHDTDRSGWWYLLAFVPLGGLAVLFFFAQPGTAASNSYGPPP